MTSGSASRAGAGLGALGLKSVGVRALRALLPNVPEISVPPVGRIVELPDRGSTYVVDIPHPDEDAPTVVLLHGLGVTASLCWAPILGALTRHARIVLFDQRWHGRGITSPHFTLEDCADDVDAVLRALDLHDVILVGYSLGGAIAQLAWWRRPERIGGLVLCSTARNYQGKPRERLFFPCMSAFARSIRPYAHGKVGEVASAIGDLEDIEVDDVAAWTRAELRGISLWSITQALDAVGRFNSAPWIGAIDVPTAVVVTARDHAIPSRRQRKLAESIPGAVVYEADGGHASIFFRAEQWTAVFIEAISDVHARMRDAATGPSGTS